MKAIILAAGRSTRLYPLTLNKPKSLLSIEGKTLIEYQIEILKNMSINDIIVVTGYLQEHFRFLKEKRIKLIYNPDFASTNNLYSLWTARNELLKSDCLCLHADVVFHPRILSKIINTNMEMGLVIDHKISLETMRVEIKERNILRVGKHVSPEKADGTFIGIAKISASASALFIQEMEKVITEGKSRDRYFTIVFESLIDKGYGISYCETEKYPWIEIDTLEDLNRAKKNWAIITGIEKSDEEKQGAL